MHDLLFKMMVLTSQSIVISEEHGGVIIIPREDGYTRYAVFGLLGCNKHLICCQGSTRK
jgi:hypothetical protein